MRESRTPGSARGAGGNSRPLYVARCPAGDHIRWTARKAVSLRCPFGDRTRAVDPAPLFHAPLFRYPGTRCGADPVYKVDRCGAVAV